MSIQERRERAAKLGLRCIKNNAHTGYEPEPLLSTPWRPDEILPPGSLTMIEDEEYIETTTSY